MSNLLGFSILLLTVFVVAMIGVIWTRKLMFKLREESRFKQDVRELDEEIRHCEDYISILPLGKKLLDFFNKWRDNKYIHISTLDYEYGKLLSYKRLKEDQYFQRLIGQQNYDDE